MRLLIYQGRDGKTRLAYNSPSSLMSRIGNTELDAAAPSLDAKLVSLAAQIIGQ